MQRARDIRQRSKPGEHPPPPKLPFNKIPSEISFLLAEHDPRIADIIGLPIFQKPNRILQMEEYHFMETHLRCENIASINIDFRFYTKLQHLSIIESTSFYFSSINHVTLNELYLEGVKNFIFTASEAPGIFKVVLKNLILTPKIFMKILAHCNPKVLHIENVKMLDGSEQALWNVYGTIMKLGILSLTSLQSFLPLFFFEKITRNKNLRSFAYDDDKITVKHRIIGITMTSLILSSLSLMECCKPCDIESLTIQSSDALSVLSYSMPRLKQLCIKGCILESNTFHKLKHLQKLQLLCCSFEGMSFYHLISRFRNTLRYFEIHATLIPLDGVLYLRKNLSNCRVVAAGSTAFYVPKASK